MRKFLPVLFLFFVSIQLFSDEMSMSMETNYRNFKPGQPIKIKIKLAQPSYLYLFVLQSDGRLNLLYPNDEEKDNLIIEDQIQIPSEKKDYDFIAGDAYGMDSVFAIASRNRIKKLHKEKYQKKSIYKNLKHSDILWIKKITKKSPPDQWIYVDTKIFISKDGITENTKQNLSKDTKIITPDSTVVIEEKKIMREFENSEVFSGYFKLPEIIRKNTKKGYFQVFKTEDSYKLKIKPNIQSTDSYCEYKISRFTKPLKAKNIFGNIESDKTKCILDTLEKDEIEFWSEFSEIFLQFNYKSSGNLKGTFWLTSKNDKFNLKLSKLQVKNEFNFLE